MREMKKLKSNRKAEFSKKSRSSQEKSNSAILFDPDNKNATSDTSENFQENIEENSDAQNCMENVDRLNAVGDGDLDYTGTKVRIP